MGMFDDVLENVGEPFKGGKGFEYGTHPVIIGVVEPTQKKVKNNPKAEVIEVEVYDKDDNERTAKCTLYFHTEGGAKMSITKVLGLIVHKVSEDKKDQVRELGKELFGGIEDLTEARDIAAKLMAEKLIDAEAFLVAEPQGKYKTTSYGDIWHYEAEPQSEKKEAADTKSDEKSSEEAVEDIPNFDDL